MKFEDGIGLGPEVADNVEGAWRAGPIGHYLARVVIRFVEREVQVGDVALPGPPHPVNYTNMTVGVVVVHDRHPPHRRIRDIIVLEFLGQIRRRRGEGGYQAADVENAIAGISLIPRGSQGAVPC